MSEPPYSAENSPHHAKRYSNIGGWYTPSLYTSGSETPAKTKNDTTNKDSFLNSQDNSKTNNLHILQHQYGENCSQFGVSNCTEDEELKKECDYQEMKRKKARITCDVEDTNIDKKELLSKSEPISQNTKGKDKHFRESGQVKDIVSECRRKSLLKKRQLSKEGSTKVGLVKSTETNQQTGTPTGRPALKTLVLTNPKKLFSSCDAGASCSNTNLNEDTASSNKKALFNRQQLCYMNMAVKGTERDEETPLSHQKSLRRKQKIKFNLNFNSIRTGAESDNTENSSKASSVNQSPSSGKLAMELELGGISASPSTSSESSVSNWRSTPERRTDNNFPMGVFLMKQGYGGAYDAKCGEVNSETPSNFNRPLQLEIRSNSEPWSRSDRPKYVQFYPILLCS